MKKQSSNLGCDKRSFLALVIVKLFRLISVLFLGMVQMKVTAQGVLTWRSDENLLTLLRK